LLLFMRGLRLLPPSPSTREHSDIADRTRMQIGEPLRTVVVEPLEPPLAEPQECPEPLAPEPEPEQEPAEK